MTEPVRFCGQCGQRLPGPVNFCGYCGAKNLDLPEGDISAPLVVSAPPAAGFLGPVEMRAPGRFGKLAVRVLLLGLLLTCVWVGFAWWNQKVLDSPIPTAASMPALTVDHPSGVNVRADENAYLERTKLEISLSEKGPSTEPFERKKSFVIIDGTTLQRGLKPATVVIPVDSEDEDGDLVVLVESVGHWIRVPSQRIKLANGGAGLQVSLDGLPLPWKLVVAKAPLTKPDDGERTRPSSYRDRIARLEQLRITDSKAFLAAIDEVAWEDDQSPGWSLYSFFAAPAHAQQSRKKNISTAYSVNQDLNEARLAFLRADALIRKLEYGNASARRSSAVKLYSDGLSHLWDARQGLIRLSQEERAAKVEDLENSHGEVVYGGTWKLEELLEYYCGTFAPWGLELTKGILEDYSVHQRGFDVRVVPYFGQFVYVDVTLPGGEKPFSLAARNKPGEVKALIVLENAQQVSVERLQMVPESVMTFQTVRFYSPRLYDWSTSEWLSSVKIVSSGLSSVFGLAVLAEGATVGGTVLAGFTVVAPIFEYIWVDPKAKKMERAGLVSQFTFYNFYDGLKLVGQLILDPKASIGKDVTEMALNWIIDFDEINLLEDTRAENRGALGYTDHSGWFGKSRFQVPPIILTSNLYGPTTHRKPDDDLGAYQSGAWASIRMSLSYAAIAERTSLNYDLSKVLRWKRPELRYPVDSNISPQTIAGIHWLPCRSQPWEERIVDDAPNLQVVHWSLSKEQLEAWSRSSGLTREKLLEEITVSVCLGDTWNTVYHHKLYDATFKFEPNSLEQMALPEDLSGSPAFAFAMAGTSPFSTREEVTSYDMTADKVGKWSTVPLYRYRIPARKKFTVRLKLEEQVLLDFFAGFGEFSGPNPSVASSLLGSGYSIEVARPVLENKEPIDIMEYLIPSAQLPSAVEERGRESWPETYGGEVLEIASLELGSRPLEGPSEYEMSHVVPLGDDVQDDNPPPSTSKPSAEPSQYWYLNLRVVRGPNQELLKKLLEETESELKSKSENKIHREFLVIDDLVVGFSGSDNETGRQMSAQLQDLTRRHIAEVKARKPAR